MNIDLVNHGARTKGAADIETGPVVGRNLERSAAAILHAEPVVGSDMEGMARHVRINDAVRDNKIIENVVGAELGEPVFGLQGPVAGDGGFDADSDEIAVAIRIQFAAAAHPGDFKLALLPCVTAEHVAESRGGEEISSAQAQIEAIGVGRGSIEPARTGISSLVSMLL